MNATQIASASTAQLVAFYNGHIEQFGRAQVKKFADRKTAEKRVAALAEEMRIEARRGIEQAKAEKAAKPATKSFGQQDVCPFCGGDHGNITAAGQDGTTAGDERALCHACGVEFWVHNCKRYNAPASSAARSEGIAASWNDPEIRAKRCERTSVLVSGPKGFKSEYGSVAKAFRALLLPMSKHIAFRIALKEAGTNEIDGYKFTAVSK